MTNQPATTTTYRVTLADGTVDDIRAQKALIADGAAIFLVDGQMIEALAHSEWRRVAGAPLPATFPGKPPEARQPRLLPATPMPDGPPRGW